MPGSWLSPGDRVRNATLPLFPRRLSLAEMCFLHEATAGFAVVIGRLPGRETLVNAPQKVEVGVWQGVSTTSEPLQGCLRYPPHPKATLI